MSQASAAQYYFDPPDPKEYTYAVTVEMDVTATNEDDALEIVKKIMEGGPSCPNDWYVENMRAYGPEVDDDDE